MILDNTTYSYDGPIKAAVLPVSDITPDYEYIGVS